MTARTGRAAARRCRWACAAPTATTRWLSVTTRAVDTGDAPAPYTVVISFTDVTEEREALDALERSNAELQQFAYIASHDLSEPLRMVSSYLQLLRRRYHGRLDDDADEFIEYAVEGATRMRSLIEGLLAYSRAGAGEESEPVDLNAVAGDVLRSLAAAIVEAQAEVDVGDLPAVTGQPPAARAAAAEPGGERAEVPRRPAGPRAGVRRAGRRRGWCSCPSRTAGSGSSPSTASACSRCSSACTIAGPTTGRASAWRSAARSWNATAGGSGWRTASGGGTAFRFTLTAAVPGESRPEAAAAVAVVSA